MQGDPTEIPRERLRRPEAADYCRRRLGQSVKINTLRTWPIPYRQIGRDAVYEIADLDRFIDARLKIALVRRPQQPPKLGRLRSELAAATMQPAGPSLSPDQQEAPVERAYEPSRPLPVPDPRGWERE
jgi:hypothetical protein